MEVVCLKSPRGVQTRKRRQERLQDKEAGIERKSIKRPKFVEDHRDGCGDCLDSLREAVGCVESIYDGYQSDANAYHDDVLAQAFPVIDPSAVAAAQPGPNPHPELLRILEHLMTHDAVSVLLADTAEAKLTGRTTESRTTRLGYLIARPVKGGPL